MSKVQFVPVPPGIHTVASLPVSTPETARERFVPLHDKVYHIPPPL